MKTRITAIFLLFVLLSQCWSSCGKDEPASEPSLTEQTEDAETKPQEEERIPCGVPDDVKLDGKTVRMLLFSAPDDFSIAAEELRGEILNDAIFSSNHQVMEDLDCVFAFEENGGIETGNIETAYTAGDDCWEAVYGTQWKVAQLVGRHMLADLNPSAGGYIDFEKPWWYAGYIGETEADNTHTYFLAGDASPSVFRRSSMLVINTDLLADIGGDIGALYDTVLEGGWTCDRFAELSGSLYIDKNGNGSRDTDDVYGFAAWTSSDLDHFMITSGVRGCSRDESGIPYITFNNEQTLRFVETFNRFFWENGGTYYTENAPTQQMFSNNQVMFLCEKFDRLDMIRDVAANYTVLPLPKLDESVPAYSSLVHDDAHILCVPAVSESVGLTTAVLEKMGSVYFYDVMPKYYEIILKSKYRRDSSEAASQIIDLIHDGMTTDFAYIYNYAISNMMCSVRDLIGISKSSDFASEFARNEKVYNKTFNKLIAAIRGEE